jgi:hypothetical protein
MKETARSGLGSSKRQAEIITAEQETLLWEKGLLGSDSPAHLLDTIFSFGLHFVLRAGQEHRNLRKGTKSQIALLKVRRGWEEVFGIHKISYNCNSGGLNTKNLNPKVTRVYEDAKNPL